VRDIILHCILVFIWQTTTVDCDLSIEGRMKDKSYYYYYYYRKKTFRWHNIKRLQGHLTNTK